MVTFLRDLFIFEEVSKIKTWFIAMRPWSFTAAFIPVALGAAIAWQEGLFHAGLFLLTLLGAIAMQAGTNLINTYGDYVAGVDTIDSAKTCPQLVTGALNPASMKLIGIAAFILALLIGLILTYLCGWPILVVGLIGLAGGYCYTAGFCPYKYEGLGSVFVFFLMGPLMVWPAYYIQTGNYSWVPVLASLPVGFLVTGILHSNDLRDIIHDKQAGIKTLAIIMGFRHGMMLYYTLYSSAYLCLIALIINEILPATTILPLALLPLVTAMFRQAYDAANGSREKLELLEQTAAVFHFRFGLLFVIGLVLSPYVNRWWF